MATNPWDVMRELASMQERLNQIKENQYHRVERAYGPFTRSFTLPTTIDANRVRAELPRRCADDHAAAA